MKNIIVDLTIYTLENQQIRWNSKFYLLSQGLPTGAKHSVPLANIFLSFIMLEGLKNSELKNMFNSRVKLWKRFIDDCTGIFQGSISEFTCFFTLLQGAFKEYDLELTCETDTHILSNSSTTAKEDKFVSFLDVELFKVDGNVHTREHRKETASKKFVSGTSAHPKYTFPGIVRSQMIRLRRLCSRENDFQNAIAQLKQRCIDSGYCPEMVCGILDNCENLNRILVKPAPVTDKNDPLRIRLVSLSGTTYEKELSDFAWRMNSLLDSSGLGIEIVKSTYLTLGQILFNNNDHEQVDRICSNEKCIVCKNSIRSPIDRITSTVNSYSYPIDTNVNCENGGIYMIQGACKAQYTGKTVDFSKRLSEHLTSCKSSAVYCHKKSCPICHSINDFEVSYIENYHKRGKYTLSEREFLWNHRIRGTINVQKTLKA